MICKLADYTHPTRRKLHKSPLRPSMPYLTHLILSKPIRHFFETKPLATRGSARWRCCRHEASCNGRICKLLDYTHTSWRTFQNSLKSSAAHALSDSLASVKLQSSSDTGYFPVARMCVHLVKFLTTFLLKLVTVFMSG